MLHTLRRTFDGKCLGLAKSAQGLGYNITMYQSRSKIWQHNTISPTEQASEAQLFPHILQQRTFILCTTCANVRGNHNKHGGGLAPAI